MVDFRRWLTAVALVAALAHSGFAQSTLSKTPEYFVALGAGAQLGGFTQPVGLFAFGKKILDELTYTTTSVDTYARSIDGHRAGEVQSIRQGVHRILWRSEQLAFAATGDFGIATAGDGSVGGAFSGQGTLIFGLKKYPGAGALKGFVSVRAINTTIAPYSLMYFGGVMYTSE